MINQKIYPNSILLGKINMDSQGGCIVAMKGKNCVAIASDLSFFNGQSILGNNTPKIFKIHDKLFLGLTGLLGDMSSLKQLLEYEVSNFLIKENRFPNHFEVTVILSNLLYKNRFSPFFTEAILAGIDETGNSVISSMDIIGAISNSNKFSVSGSCSDGLYGICETLWKPNMSEKELFNVIGKCINLTSNRDCLSGWGCNVYLLTKHKIIKKKIEHRVD